MLQTLEILPGYLLPKSSVSSCITFLKMKEKTSYVIRGELTAMISLYPAVKAALFLTKDIWFLLLCSQLFFKRVLGSFKGTAAPGLFMAYPLISSSINSGVQDLVHPSLLAKEAVFN